MNAASAEGASASGSGIGVGGESEDARSHEFIELSPFNLFWIYVGLSIVGLVVETLVSYPIDGVWKDRAGLVWGPFSPIYGLGAVIMTVVLNRMRDSHPLRIFLAAAVLGGAFEWAVGWFWEYAFGIVAWSYIDEPLNFGGHTSVRMMAVWGVAGLLWMKVGLPLTMKAIGRIPQHARGWLTAVCAAFMAVNIAVTLVSFGCWFERQSGYPVITPVQEFFAENFGDEFMEDRFQTMTMWTELAGRR